jgi:DNA-binding response OmpR family regulator
LVARVIESRYSIHQAFNGVEGLEFLEKNLVDLIILDVNMPEMAGEETLERIRDVNDSVPVFLLTGETQSSTIGSLLRMGVANYILKPFNPAELLKKIMGVLGDGAEDDEDAESAEASEAADGVEVSNDALLSDTLEEPESPEDLDELVAKHGTIFALLRERVGNLATAKSYMEDHYSGKWGGLNEWAKAYIEKNGFLESLPPQMIFYFDFLRYSTDQEESGAILVFRLGADVHVFDGLDD